MGTRWRGMLVPINEPTGDGRRMAPGAITSRPLPLPLKWQRQDESGHTTSVVVGSMDRLNIDEENGGVWGEGELFDDVSPTTNPRLAEDVNEALFLLKKKTIGPSVDPGGATAVTVIKGESEAADEAALQRYWMKNGQAPETELLFTNYEIAAATLVPVPAFAQCRPFELLDGVTEATGDRQAVLAACPAMPPLDPALFQDPQLAEYTAYTERDLGNGWVHVFGHVASHDVCHVGMPGVCTTAPYSEQDYQPFHRYHTTESGIPLPVVAGRLTAGFGKFEGHCRCHPGNDDHACGNVTFGAAIAHHDRMETLAYVCAGEDEANNGIWFSGVRAPEVSERGKALLRRRKVSGDWREYGPSMELTEVLVLARREPGFPLPRVSLFNGRQRSLTAAGTIAPPAPVEAMEAPAVAVEGLDYDRLGAIIARQLMDAAGLTAAVRTDWSDVPVADGDPSWDKGAAVRRLAAWADGDISGRYAQAFLWRDPDADPDLQGAYKLPIADVVDGRLTIIPSAVRNAAARLNQVDGLTDDEESSLRTVIDKIMERVRGDDDEDADDDRDGDDEGAVTAAAPDSYSGGMVALRMTDEDAARLAVEGGLPPEDLHLTLGYLGDDMEQVGSGARERIVRSMTKIAKKIGAPIKANGFGVAAFNPGKKDGNGTAIVMNVSGDMLQDVQAATCKALGNCEGDDFTMPEQHSPWHAHTTLTYDDESRVPEYADRIGPLTFNRIRVAFGGENIDIPLGEIVADDERAQERRDEDGEMYARMAAVNRFTATLWAVEAEERASRAATLSETINMAALAAAE